MTRWAMMSDFSIRLPDRPGELARVAGKLKQAGVNLVGLWGSGPGNEQARFRCVPEQAEAFRRFAEEAGLEVSEGRTFYLTGADQPGALVEWLEKIASAGINLQAIEFVGIHGEFGGFIWAGVEDHDRLARLLT